MTETITRIKAAFEADSEAAKAIAAYSQVIASPASAEEQEDALVERGMLYWRGGERALAINDYNAALRLNPESRALQLRKSCYEILDFYHRDLYNP